MTTKETALVVARPPSVREIETLANHFAQSGFFSDSKGLSQAVTKILAGQELGIGPVTAMTGIYIVKGHVTLSANLIGAAIKRSQRYNYRVKHLAEDKCSITFMENGQDIGESTFTMEDAKTAGLDQGDNWRKYKRNMLFARALSNGAKWFCPDVFGGPVYTPDELGETIDGETGEIIQNVIEHEASAEEDSRLVTEAQVKRLWAIARSKHILTGAVADFMLGEGMPASTKDLTRTQYETVITWLERPDPEKVTADAAVLYENEPPQKLKRSPVVTNEMEFFAAMKVLGYETEQKALAAAGLKNKDNLAATGYKTAYEEAKKLSGKQ